MESTLNIQFLLLQIVLILSLFIIIVLVLKFTRANKLDRFIGKYSVDSIKYSQISIFDKILNQYNKILRNISNILNDIFLIKKRKTVNKRRIVILVLTIILAFLLIFTNSDDAVINNAIEFKGLERLWVVIASLIFKLSPLIVLALAVFINVNYNNYDKYYEYSKNKNMKPIDYISLKLIFIFVLFLSVIFSNLLRGESLSILQCYAIIIVGFSSPDIFLIIQEIKRKKKVDEDMLKAIIIMNSAFKSGRTTIQAVEIVKNELSGPIGEEFNRMYTDISFGLALDKVFERFSIRVNNEDAKYIASSLTILNKTGGNITKVFSSIEKSFFNRRKIKNELDALTSSSNVMFRLLIALPIIIFGLLYILNPNYFNPLFTTTPGIIIIVLILIIFVTYIYIIKSIMKIRV